MEEQSYYEKLTKRIEHNVKVLENFEKTGKYREVEE